MSSLKMIDIMEIVASESGCVVASFIHPIRTRKATLGRHVAIYMCRKHTSNSLKAIGARFNRDHTSVILAINNIESKLAVEGFTEVHQLIQAVEAKILQRAYKEVKNAVF